MTRSTQSPQFSPNEMYASSDDDLMFENSSSPRFTCLQRVALRHKYRFYSVQNDLARETGKVAILEVQSREQAERIAELSYTLATDCSCVDVGCVDP